jgi:hypothetical protein
VLPPLASRAALVAIAGLLALPCAASAGTARIRGEFDGRAGVTYETVVYDAAPGELNSVTSDSRDTGVTLRDPAGITPGPGCSRPDPADPTRAVCTYTSTDVGTDVPEITLGDGDDRAEVLAGTADLNGGAGNDTLLAGAGSARFDGGPGNDRMEGGAGGDAYVTSRDPDGADVMVGGGGRDIAYYDARRSSIRVSLDGRADDGAPGEGDNVGADVEFVFAGSGNDRLVGSSADNTLGGGRGSDTIYGRGGDDNIEGTTSGTGARPLPDHERLDGGSGNDRLFGGDGADLLIGGPGQDEISGGSRADRIRADDGEADRVDCFGGRDSLRLDALDFARSERGVYGHCEQIKRRGTAAALLANVGPQFVNTVTESLGRSIELEGGCPADGPAVCRARLRVTLDGRVLLDKPFRAGRGHTRRLRLPIPASLRARLRLEPVVTASARVSSRDRHGHPAVRRRPLILTSDLGI